MKLHEMLRKYVEEIFSAPNSILYHYTDFGKEMISSKHLKMSSHDDLNKKNNRELKVGPEITREKLKNSSFHRMLPLFNEYIKRGIKVYVSSFCEEENRGHAIKNYGEDCIGFRPEFTKLFFNNNSALLGYVKYNLKDQKKIISEMFDLYGSSSDDPQEKILLLFLWLSVIFPLLKEEIDHIDNECRIITAEGRDRYNPTKIVGKACLKKSTSN